MKQQEDYYLPYDEFRKNATEESVKAFVDMDHMAKVIPNFDISKHVILLKSYAEKQFEEIQKISEELSKSTDAVSITNSPTAGIVDGKLKYHILLISGDSESLSELCTPTKGLDLIKYASKEEILSVIPDDFEDDFEDATLALFGDNIKMNFEDLFNIIENLGVITRKNPNTGEVEKLYPFLDNYVQLVSKMTNAFSLYKSVKDKEGSIEKIKNIEKNILETSSYHSEEDVKNMVKDE